MTVLPLQSFLIRAWLSLSSRWIRKAGLVQAAKCFAQILEKEKMINSDLMQLYHYSAARIEWDASKGYLSHAIKISWYVHVITLQIMIIDSVSMMFIRDKKKGGGVGEG